MIICPNLSNPEVAREFEELKQATSEQAAYHIWSLNNGNAIDKAPNGAKSKLFLTLLEYYKGDRTKAIQAKAKTYGKSFLVWFGDWIGLYEDSLDSEGVTRSVQDNGKIRLSLPSHTDEHPRQIVLEPQGDNKYYVHMRIWDGEKIPGEITDEDKRKLFNALYKELPVGAEILFPKSGEGNYATRGTVAGLMRLSKDSRFDKGSEGVLLYLDKDGSIKEYRGTSFIKVDTKNVSKVVDENGEPLVVWHGGAKNIRIFKHSSEDNTTTGNGYYTDPNTGEEIPVDSANAMFFSSNRFVGTSYASLYGINTFSRILAKVETLIGYLADPLWFFKESGEGLRFKLLFKNPDKDLIDLLDDLSTFNSRFGNLKNYYIQITSQNKKLNDKEKKAFRDMLIQVRKTLYDYTGGWIMNRSEWEYVYNRAIRLIDEYNNPDGIKRLINGEIPETIKKEWELYKKIEAHREKEGKSKIANYEDLTITLGKDRYYISYDGNLLSLWTPDYSDPNVSEMTEELLSDFLTNAKYSAERGILDLKDETIYLEVKNKAQEYPVFLNIKNPLSHDYEGTHLGQGYKESNKYPFGYVAARLVRKAIKEGNDGVIYENLYDPYLANNYGVFNPNLIKSATSNQGPSSYEGTYSRENDDIYYNKSINPYKIPSNKKNYSVLSINASLRLDNYLKKSRGVYPTRFYDDKTGVTYIKSNTNKRSKRYDVIDTKTGEIIAQGKILFTQDLWDALQEAKRNLDNSFRHYNTKRSFAFKKGISTPSKSLFKRMAKLFLLEAIKAQKDVTESAINHEVIDDFVDLFNDTVWEHIITYTLNPTHGPNRDDDAYDSGMFGLATSNFYEVFYKFAFNRTIPKLGLIDELSKQLGRNIENERFTGYIKGKYYDHVKIDRTLPYDVLLEMLMRIADVYDSRNENERIKAYADATNSTVDEVKLYIQDLREEGTIESSKTIQDLLYNNPLVNIVLKIKLQYSSLYKQWLNDKGITIPENIVNIVFNRDSYSGEDTPLLRLATIMHEPWHALEMLHYGSDAHRRVREAFDVFIHTEYGKEVWNNYKHNNIGYSEGVLPDEFLADLFSLIMMPSQLRNLYAEITSPYLGPKLAKDILTILDLPEFDSIILADESKITLEEFTEEQKVVLPLIKQIYNAIIKWLSEYSNFVKNTFKLYDEIQKKTSYKRTDSFVSHEYKIKNDNLFEFKEALEHLSLLIQQLALQPIQQGSAVPASTFFNKRANEYGDYYGWSIESITNHLVDYVINSTGYSDILAKKHVKEINQRYGTNFGVYRKNGVRMLKYNTKPIWELKLTEDPNKTKSENLQLDLFDENKQLLLVLKNLGQELMNKCKG